MDPFFRYLNQIPRVFSVQAYVDDTTIVGDAQSLDWICKVSHTYHKVRTAGFVVDSHTCYRSLPNSVMKFPPHRFTDEELVLRWLDLLHSCPYSTAYEALKANMCSGYNTLIVRVARAKLRTNTHAEAVSATVADHLAVNYSFSQAVEILQGRETHCVGAFATASCSCKSKSHVVTNYALRPSAISLLEKSGYVYIPWCLRHHPLGWR